MTKLELYDCTLREGEQAAGASFDIDSRVRLFSLLDDFGFDYIELGWPVASSDILKSFELCRKIRKKAKIVAFGSTSIKEKPEQDENLDSIIKSKPDYACIFGKSHLEHVKKQLKLTAQENLKRIFESIKFLKSNNINVFYDAEHYFDAFKSNKKYAIQTLIAAIKAGAERIILCDTNGGTLPFETEKILKETIEILKSHNMRNINFGVHFHNDSGLALASTLQCLKYITQIQGTINGIGERIGNLNFSEFIPVYIGKLRRQLNVKLKDLKKINEEAFILCGMAIHEKQPFVGDYAFAHKGGVHIDALNKGASYEHINPEDFGNKRVIILNSLGGSAGVVSVASQLGFNIDKKDESTREKIKKLFIELKKLEEKGYNIGSIRAEQYILIEKYFGQLKEFFYIKDWKLETKNIKNKEVSIFSLSASINKKIVKEKIKINGGPVDAAYKTLIKFLSKYYPAVKKLKLIDYNVGIARRKAEESTVRTLIKFKDTEEFSTVGVDSNIIQSSIEAISKAFIYYLNKVYKYPSRLMVVERRVKKSKKEKNKKGEIKKDVGF